MRRTLIALALASLGAATLASPSLPLASEALLHSARMWEAHDRSDLALLALQKLVAARPDAPEALLALGELALRMDDVTTAQSVLDQLQMRFDNNAIEQTFALEYRFATSDRLQLAQLKRLVETSQTVQARAEFSRLFPHGAPQGYLSLEYYSLLARLPGNWQRVYDSLRSLNAQHPDEPRYQFALARQLLRRDEFSAQGVRLLDDLTRRDDVRRSEVDDELIVALKALGPQSASADIVRRYVQRHDTDAEAANLLAQIKAYQEREASWRREVLALIAPASRTTNQTELETTLDTLRQSNADLNEALNSLHQLERELPAKHASLEQTVAQWRQRGRDSLKSARYADAKLQLAIAVALRKEAFESTIALAEQLESRNLSADCGALLAVAGEFDPASSWLFETRVRWLIKQGDTEQALSLLDARPVDNKYTAATRDNLRGAALRQRADRNAIAAPQKVIADLQAALVISPTDVWLRYRLAKLYAQHGQADQGRALMMEGVRLAPGDAQLRYAQGLFLSGIDDTEAALVALQAIDGSLRSAEIVELQQRLERAQALREIDQLIEQQHFGDANARLDALLAREPNDRSLRIQRAELEMRAHHPQAARDRFAVLVAEQPDDIDSRLDYVRALIDSGDLQLARLQLQLVQHQASPNDAKLQLSIAWRAWSLDDASMTVRALQPVLPQLNDDADAWLLAGRSDLTLRQFAAAHEHLLHAEQLSAGKASTDARELRLALDARLDDVLNVAAQARHKAGDAGISQFDSFTIPSAWQWALNYQQHLTLRADAVSLDAGTLGRNFDAAALFGSVYSAGPTAGRTFENDAQRGVAFAAIHATDGTTIDLGTTPLGFELPQIVGGVEWRPNLTTWDVKLGVSRRAVTSSVLSYAGMRDPITGAKWGGVVASGPYAQAGLYREQYSVAGALRTMQITGTHVLSNQFIGARIATDYRWLAWSQDASWLGLSLNYWHYQHNLQNYTFGSGGYYSPQSYVSLALPVEWQGARNAWSYQLRAAAAYSHSHTERIAFYPIDFTLQQQAILQAQAANDGEPWFAASSGGGVSFSASAKVERLMSEHLVIGGEFSLDHADYYHPAELSLYMRRVFGGPAAVKKPPSTLRPYND